jgi:hypothetical protein
MQWLMSMILAGMMLAEPVQAMTFLGSMWGYGDASKTDSDPQTGGIYDEYYTRIDYYLLNYSDRLHLGCSIRGGLIPCGNSSQYALSRGYIVDGVYTYNIYGLGAYQLMVASEPPPGMLSPKGTPPACSGGDFAVVVGASAFCESCPSGDTLTNGVCVAPSSPGGMDYSGWAGGDLSTLIEVILAVGAGFVLVAVTITGVRSVVRTVDPSGQRKTSSGKFPSELVGRKTLGRPGRG